MTYGGIIAFLRKTFGNYGRFFWNYKNACYVCIRNGDDLPRYPGFEITTNIF